MENEESWERNQLAPNEVPRVHDQALTVPYARTVSSDATERHGQAAVQTSMREEPENPSVSTRAFVALPFRSSSELGPTASVYSNDLQDSAAEQPRLRQPSRESQQGHKRQAIRWA